MYGHLVNTVTSQLQSVECGPNLFLTLKYRN